MSSTQTTAFATVLAGVFALTTAASRSETMREAIKTSLPAFEKVASQFDDCRDLDTLLGGPPLGTSLQDERQLAVLASACIVEMNLNVVAPRSQTRLPRIMLYGACKHIPVEGGTMIRACQHAYAHDVAP